MVRSLGSFFIPTNVHIYCMELSRTNVPQRLLWVFVASTCLNTDLVYCFWMMMMNHLLGGVSPQFQCITFCILCIFLFSLPKRLFFPFLYYFEVSDLWSLSQDGRIGSIYSFIHINNLYFLYIIFQTMGRLPHPEHYLDLLKLMLIFLLIWV